MAASAITVPGLDQVHTERLDGRRLPDARHTGDAHVDGTTRVRHQLQQQLLGLPPVIGAGRLDEGDRPRQAGTVPATHRRGQFGH